MTMTPEMIALSAVAWIFFLTSALVTALPASSSTIWLARIFESIVRVVERALK